MDNKKNEAIIQFSGGIDSLYTALMLAKQYDKVHLLTFYKGYLHFGMNLSSVNIETLKKHAGEDKVEFHVLDMKELFKRVAVKNFRENSKKFGNEIAWCIPCRASMAVMSIDYALKHNIPYFTDGANWEQTPDGEKIIATADNYPGYLTLIKDFAKSYGVEYFSPVYDINTREERRNILLDLGFKIDYNSLDVENPKSPKNYFKKEFYKRYQPICLSGWLLHWKRNFFNKREDTSEKRVLEFIEPVLNGTARKFIDERRDES